MSINLLFKILSLQTLEKITFFKFIFDEAQYCKESEMLYFTEFINSRKEFQNTEMFLDHKYGWLFFNWQDVLDKKHALKYIFHQNRQEIKKVYM